MKKKLMVASLCACSMFFANAQTTGTTQGTNKNTKTTNKSTTTNSTNKNTTNKSNTTTNSTNPSKGTSTAGNTTTANGNATGTNRNNTSTTTGTGNANNTTGSGNMGTTGNTGNMGNTNTGNMSTNTGSTGTGSTNTTGTGNTQGNMGTDHTGMNHGTTDAGGQMTSTGRYAAMGVQTGSLHKKDMKFVMLANSSNMLEIQASQLALQNASSQAVKDFAAMMVQHHTMAATEMKNMLANKGAMIPDTAMLSRHRTQIDLLSSLQGAAFDKAYMRLMVDAHEEDVDEFEDETTDARDADIRAFATRMMPTLRTHYTRAKELRKQIR